jgi:exosortase
LALGGLALAGMGLLTPLLWATLTTIVRAALEDPNSSHAFLVPPLACWLAWRNVRGARPAVAPAVGAGLSHVAGGLVVHLAASVVSWPVLDFVGVFLLIRGLALVWGGREWARALLGPSLFLFFMFPLPVGWTGAAALWLQDVVSTISGAVLDWLWVCHRQGNALHLAGFDRPIIVGEECSGLRQLAAFAGLACLIGQVGLNSAGRQLVLLAVAFPVAVAANILRILLLAALGRWLGPAWVEGWLHFAPVALTLPVGLAMILASARALGGGVAMRGRRTATPAAPTPGPSFDWLPAAGANVLLAAGCCVSFALDRHMGLADGPAPTGLRRPLAELPEELIPPPELAQETDSVSLGAWHSQPVAKATPSDVPFYADEWLTRYYAVPEAGLIARVFLAYSADGSDRQHHPEICLRDVSGWPEDRAARATLELNPAVRSPAARFRFYLGTSRPVTVYYWHYTVETPLPDGATWLQRLHRRLARGGPSLTVQVATNAHGEGLTRIERELLPALDEALRASHLPAGVRQGAERLPIRLTAGHEAESPTRGER